MAQKKIGVFVYQEFRKNTPSETASFKDPEPWRKDYGWIDETGKEGRGKLHTYEMLPEYIILGLKRGGKNPLDYQIRNFPMRGDDPRVSLEGGLREYGNTVFGFRMPLFATDFRRVKSIFDRQIKAEKRTRAAMERMGRAAGSGR